MSNVHHMEGRKRRRRRATEDREDGNTSIDVSYLPVAKRQARSDLSRQIEDDDAFVIDGINQNVIVQTPFNMQSLHMLHERSNTLRQCIQAYATNITSNGWRVVPRQEGGVMDRTEAETLQSFIDSPNPEESLRSIHDKTVTRYEKYGFSFVEVVRNRVGKPSLLKAAKPSSIRMSRRGEEEVLVKVTIRRGGRRSRVIERKRFRVYVQEVGKEKVYYKQFGDPRRLHYKTGKFESDDYTVDDADLATELIHFKQESEDPYGIPRWVSMIPAILGSREAEEVNLKYFEDNTVPPMIISVAGGKITQQSYRDMKDVLQGKGIGKDRQHQIMLLEAIPEVADIDGKGTVTLQVEKLTDARQSDGLFKEYDESNSAKIRSAFRLPPVFLGMSQDMTFATANVSAYIAEVQVFAPERQRHDEQYNKMFVNHPSGLNLKTVKLESRGPSNTSPDQVVKTLTALNVMGGLTPRSAIDAVNETMRLSIPQYPEKGADGYMPWMDQPMPYSLATSKSQQTGEGQTTQSGQKAKSPEGKKVEATGDTGPSVPEHGQE